MAGIIDFDICLPGDRANVHRMHAASGVPVAEIQEITGCEEFPVLGPDESAWRLAQRAASAVLERTGVPPERVRFVLYAGSGQWDRPFWSPAAKVAHELGIERAHCFEVTNFCNATMAAVRIAADKIDLGAAEYALVLSGDRLSQLLDYTDPNSADLFNFGDAGAAVLVGADGYSFEVLHSAMRTDPSWADYYDGEHRPHGVAIRRNGYRAGLSTAYVDNFVTLARQTLDALGRKLSDVAYLLINHGDKRMHERLLRELGLSAERSVFNYHRLGHMGGADTLIALRDLLALDRLHKGDLLLLATSAMGFSWGVTAIEYQPCPDAAR